MASLEEQAHLYYASTCDEEDDQTDIEEEEPQNDKDYTVLAEADIRQRQDDAIAAVCSVLSLSKTGVCLLLRRHNWNPSAVYEEWFSGEDRARKAVGLMSENETTVIQFSSLSPKEVTCGICFDDQPLERIYSAACGHPFCESCWKSYIHTAVNDGPRCLTLRCPEQPCGGAAAVALDMIELLAFEEDIQKYSQFLLRSYIEQNKKFRWCPAPGCDYAIEHDGGGYGGGRGGGGGGGEYNVTCICSHTFCFNCAEESHRPVSCNTAAKWMNKNAVESDNTRWIVAYTKPCPKCKRPIEKNRGCNHIICPPLCNYSFCWLCLQDWTRHGSDSCNLHQTKSTTSQEIDQINDSQKYSHYYERWASNEDSKQRALSGLRKMEDIFLDKLSEIQNEPKSLLGFVIEAWRQIVECRRILKWSYVYGYYMDEKEGTTKTKKKLLEYLQGGAEWSLERLHECAEMELQEYVEEGGKIGRKKMQMKKKKFGEFCLKLKGLTCVTKKYFENLVRGLENGIPEVDS